MSIPKLALENGINASLLFRLRQQWREGKLLPTLTGLSQLLPFTLNAPDEFLVVQPELPAE
ncbi:TPA: hypothetical protein RY256_003616 [Salmonella enterica]|nr:hypothetical protein [Salmonella enterica subsp. enterica serovar Typhimurium]EGI6490487.1 hypothetical protein [Salmonella enterica subsp. enterica serovar Hvittingfoss]EHL2886371.1 hypothetical protein [Salmonella enterica]EIF2862113.1 hypothetical protein [Salmonella enterica]HEB0786546.1 hypothetical protein [Salmonella enterica]